MGVCRPVLQFQTKKCNFPHPFSDQTSKIHARFQTWPLNRNYVIITYIRLERQQKNSYKSISNSHFFFFLTHLELKRQRRSYNPVVSSKTIPIPDQNGQSVYPFSDQNGVKILPDGAAHTCKAYIRWSLPPGILRLHLYLHPLPGVIY